MSHLKLFENLPQRKILVEFKSLPDISDSKSSVKGRIIQFKDITNPERQVILNFDLEGRLTDIELGARSLDSNVKILERSFDGRFYVYSENCKNLRSTQKRVYRYYDYYHESVCEDLKTSKILVDSVSSLLKEISQMGYKSSKKIIFVKNLSMGVIEALENAQKKIQLGRINKRENKGSKNLFYTNYYFASRSKTRSKSGVCDNSINSRMQNSKVKRTM